MQEKLDNSILLLQFSDIAVRKHFSSLSYLFSSEREIDMCQKNVKNSRLEAERLLIELFFSEWN